MTNLGLFDCDTHCYEPRDAFTRYLPSEFADRAILPARNGKGDEVILVGNRVAVFNSESGLGFDMAYRPGSLKEMLRQMGSGNPDETYEPEPIRPEYLERAPRLEVMARQGVEKTVLYPAGMALAAEHYCDDTEALYANLRSFNRWYDEEWGFDRDGTIYAVGMLSLRDLDSAVAETDALIAAGARVVLIPTGPAYGRSPGRSLLRSGVVAARRSGRHPRAAHHAVLVLRRHLARVGSQLQPRRVAHVGVAVEQHLRRTTGRGHALGADLRQRVRSPSEPARGRVRARRRMGAALPSSHGQESRHGTQRSVEGRHALGAAERDLPTPRARRAVPRGRHPLDRREPRATTTASSWAPTTRTPRGWPNRPTS